MLSIAKVRRGGERYYLDAVARGAEDHRTPGREPDGVWLGRGSAALGLGGSVGGAQLAALLAGSQPSSGEVLNPAQGRVRVAGFDLVFAAPKSVSLCYALGDASVAQEVRSAHDAAVAAAVGYLERQAITARRGSGDQRRQVAVDGVVGAAFLHRTSRAPDPHLHTHVLVANLVEASGGRWSAFDARGLYAHARTAGYLYQAHLRHELSRRLGLEWETVRNGMADVVGIDRPAISAFSRRRQEIQARLAEEGRSGVRAARVAQLATRRGKDLDTTFESLVGEWRGRADAAGLGRDRLAAVMGGTGRPRPPEHLTATDDWIRRIVGPDGLTGAASAFSRRDVIRACCSSLASGADVATVEGLADSVLSSPLVQLASVGGHEPRWTTPEVVAAERLLVEHARRRAHAGVGRAEPRAVEAALWARPHLAPAQRAAVRDVLTTRAGVIVATGGTWAGATDALDAAREAWQSSGLRVQALASSPERAAEIESRTGIETTSSADVLAQLERPASPASCADVLIVHDAGRIRAGATKKLLEGAERAGTKVVLVGEVRELRAVAGGAFRRLGESLGSIALDAPRSMATPDRAAGRGWVDVVERGAGGAAVVVGSSAPAVRQRLVADWWAERETGREPVMVASHRRELDALNAGARAELAATGRLGESITVGHRAMAVGDRVLVGRGGRGAGVPTGTRAAVVGVDTEREMLDLRTEQGRALSMSAATAVGIELRYAYAVTPREARRARPERALVLGGEGGACGSGGSDRCYVVDGVGRSGRPAPHDSIPGPGSSLGLLARHLEGLDQRLARAVAPDPTAALAQLDQELARSDARLRGARCASADAAARLEDLGARRSWTHRSGARQEARDTRTELAYQESEVRRWEARRDHLGERRRQLEGQAAARSASLAARRPHLARREVLVHAADRRQRVLVRAAEVSPPGYLVSEIGVRPTAQADRAAWREAALAVESYRERWGVGDPHHALGGPAARSTPLEQRLQRDAAERLLDGAQRRLRPELAIERSSERGRALEPASPGGR